MLTKVGLLQRLNSIIMYLNNLNLIKKVISFLRLLDIFIQ